MSQSLPETSDLGTRDISQFYSEHPGYPKCSALEKGSESDVLALRRRGRGSCRSVKTNEKGLSVMKGMTGAEEGVCEHSVAGELKASGVRG